MQVLPRVLNSLGWSGIRNTTIQHCIGGETTQGAGALAIQSFGETSGLSVDIQDSMFASNRASNTFFGLSPLTGAAGAIRIYAKSSDATTNHAKITNTPFRLNSLDTACIGGFCMAGAVAASVQTAIVQCDFDSNTCQQCSGALYADRALELRDCALTNNTATKVFYGSGKFAELSAVVNTSIQFNGPKSGIMFSNLSTYNQFVLTCPAGEEVDTEHEGDYTCRACPSEFTSLLLF